MNILEAMDAPALFGADFTGESGEPGRVLLSSLFALDGPSDAELFAACTGRQEPQAACSCWRPTGDRRESCSATSGGSSRCRSWRSGSSALRGVYSSTSFA